MAYSLEDLPTLVAAASMVLLAALLLLLDFERRLHRVFGLFLTLRALFLGLLALSETVDDFAGRLRVYSILALPFAGFYFAAVYLRRPRPERRARSTRILGWSLLAGAIAVESLYAWRHDLFFSDGELRPLALLIPLSYAVLGSIGWLFAREGSSSVPGPDRQGMLLVALAFCLEPLHQSAFRFLSLAAGGATGTVDLAVYGRRPVLLAELALWGVALAFVAAAALLLLRTASHEEVRRARRALPLPLVTATVSALLFAGLATDVGRAWFRPVHFGFQALWSLAVPVVVCYALVRHRVFDLDVRLRWTISKGSVAIAFLAVFFIAAQLTQNFLSDRFGWFAGGIAAGLLLFAITPLQRLGERMAHATVPRARPVGDLGRSEKEQLYLEQVSLAWTDGTLTRKQRLLLDRLRERLDLTVETAHRLENAAARRG